MFDDNLFTPDGLYVHQGSLYPLEPSATRFYPVSDRARMKAIMELVGRNHVVYAMQIGDLIKIGTTQNLALRCKRLKGKVLAFTAGSYGLEHQVHTYLADDLDHGLEWYHPTDRVMSIVNLWRENLGMDELIG